MSQIFTPSEDAARRIQEVVREVEGQSPSTVGRRRRPVAPAAPAALACFRFVSEHVSDSVLIICRTWDGMTEGPDDVEVVLAPAAAMLSPGDLVFAFFLRASQTWQQVWQPPAAGFDGAYLRHEASGRTSFDYLRLIS